MKSYFAKLAARATLPNAPPAPSRAMPVDDPFENVSTADTPRPSENVSLSEGPKTRSSEPRRAQSAANTDEIVLSRGRGREVTVESESYSQPVTPRTPNASVHEDAPERVREIEHADHETSQQPPVVKLEPNQSARPKVTRDETSTPDTAAIPAEPREPVTSHSADQSVNETNAEQTISLKKADEFMKAFFARRTTRPAAESYQEKEQPAPVVKPVVAREPTSRLQPAAKQRQQAEPPLEQPSLVIGKLTVEVVPPPSPPVTPRREVVVVRTGSNSRSASIPSSQRFGLGQF